MSKYKDIETKAKDYYFNKWRGSEKKIQAFGEIVYVNRIGWNHIVHHPRRSLKDKIIRLKKLELARKVLETSSHYQTVEVRGQFYYYGIQAIVEDTRVKVIITSKGAKGKKILFSVMFKSISRQQQKIIDKQNDKLINEFRKSNPRIISRRKN
ncbi:MAG: hypothetical protein WC827_05035 [Candidatus Paceibacterota bacterium]|jgi:uncharacterized protein YlbG (UPF0298 family)